MFALVDVSLIDALQAISSVRLSRATAVKVKHRGKERLKALEVCGTVLGAKVDFHPLSKSAIFT